MIDEQLGWTAGAWLRDTDEPAFDPQGIVTGAMAQLPRVPQAKASGLRARIEREVVPVPGTTRLVPDQQIRKGGPSMYPALRFTMAAIALLATGGLLFAVMQSSTDDAVAPVPATSSTSPAPTASTVPSQSPGLSMPSSRSWTSEGIRATADLRAIADANGWTIDQAKAQQAANRGVDRIASAIVEQLPDDFIGSALAEEPGGAPSLYIKGPAPQWVLDLVAAAGGPITVVDEQPYSFDELEARQDRVHQALVDAGYPNVATGVDITGGGIIPVSLMTVAGLSSDPEAILAFVPEELRADVQLDVTIAPPRPSTGPGAWGPLAVVHQPAGFGAGVGLGPVTLRIGEACVWFESKQGRNRTTLVFEGDHVDWRPAKRRIVFTDRRGETVRLSDGDRIEGGGVSLWPPQGPEGEAPPTPEPGRRWHASLDEAWLAEPDASCPERLFFLSEVTVRKGRR